MGDRSEDVERVGQAICVSLFRAVEFIALSVFLQIAANLSESRILRLFWLGLNGAYLLRAGGFATVRSVGAGWTRTAFLLLVTAFSGAVVIYAANACYQAALLQIRQSPAVAILDRHDRFDAIRLATFSEGLRVGCINSPKDGGPMWISGRRCDSLRKRYEAASW